MSKFGLGRLVATNTVAQRMVEDDGFSVFVNTSLERYVACDWGDLVDEDRALNDEAVQTGDSRILAAYTMPKTDTKIWIITEADRSVTTILYPDEY